MHLAKEINTLVTISALGNILYCKEIINVIVQKVSNK